MTTPDVLRDTDGTAMRIGVNEGLATGSGKATTLPTFQRQVAQHSYTLSTSQNYQLLEAAGFLSRWARCCYRIKA